MYAIAYGPQHRLIIAITVGKDKGSREELTSCSDGTRSTVASGKLWRHLKNAAEDLSLTSGIDIVIMYSYTGNR